MLASCTHREAAWLGKGTVLYVHCCKAVVFFYHDLLRDAWQAGLAMCDHALEAKMSSISSCHSGARDQFSCGVLPADGEGSHVFAVDGR